jgi:hypothetical protein
VRSVERIYPSWRTISRAVDGGDCILQIVEGFVRGIVDSWTGGDWGYLMRGRNNLAIDGR